MAGGGKNRKTRRAKVIAGTFRADRDRSGLPASPGIPTPPPELQGEALRKWREIVQRRGLKQVLTEHDREALTGLCISWATMLDAYEQIQKRGALVVGYRGALVKNPAVQIWRDASAALAGWLARFGMTPRDRATVDALEEADEDDAFEKFLNSGPGSNISPIGERKQQR